MHFGSPGGILPVPGGMPIAPRTPPQRPGFATPAAP
jgi:hypothetical protein